MTIDAPSQDQERIIRECRDKGYRLDRCAWPGGYPIFYVTRRSDVLCPACAAKAVAEYDRSSLILALGFGDLDYDAPDWQWELGRGEMIPETRDLPEGRDCHWEGPPLDCADCQEDIPSAYGDPDSDD
jgi:hypothetical protein